MKKALVGGIAVILVTGGLYLGKRSYDARVAEQELADAWDGYRRCLLGEAPLAGEDPFDRVRRMTLTARAHAELAPPAQPGYPVSCLPYAQALQRAIFDARFLLVDPNEGRAKSEEGSVWSLYLVPSREDWARLWEDAALLRARPVRRPVPVPPPPAHPLSIDRMTPLGPAPFLQRSRVITTRARIKLSDRACVIEKDVARCGADTYFPGDDDTFLLEDGAVARVANGELTVSRPSEVLRVAVDKSARLRGDALVWLEGPEGNKRLIARDVRPHAPLLGPRVEVGSFSNLSGAVCRTDEMLVLHGNGIAMRRYGKWSSYAAPAGNMSCDGDAIITAMDYADSFYRIRAWRCGADSCREEIGSTKEWFYPGVSSEKRLGPLLFSVGSHLAIVDDRAGLWVRASATAPGTTSLRGVVLDDTRVGGTAEAVLRDVAVSVGQLVLLVESRGSVYAIRVLPDGTFSPIRPAP